MNTRTTILAATLALSALLLACSSSDSSPSTGDNAGDQDSGAAGAGGASEQTDAASDTGPAPKPTCENMASKTLAQLNTEEKKVACDCAAAKLGGYNKWFKCGSGEVCVFETQADCLKLQPKCAITVSEYFTCWEGQAKDPCAEPPAIAECKNFVSKCF